MGSQTCEYQGLTLDSFNSDIQSKIASKMTTSDLARIRVSFQASETNESMLNCLQTHIVMPGIIVGNKQVLEGHCRPFGGK